MGRLIGLYSPAPQSGKTTLAQGLAGHGYRREQFAGALRAMLRTLLDWQGMAPDEIRDRLDGTRKEEPCDLLGGRSARHAMRTLGTEWGREAIAGDLWVQAAMARIRARQAEGWGVVVDDMRFRNEAEAIRAAGGLLVRITRPGAAPHPVVHASEGGLDGWRFDLELVNDACSPIAFVLQARAAIARAEGRG
jgi:hypothetical protein